MKKYVFILKADSGEFKLSTVARTLETAIIMVCNAECCPESAIRLVSITNL